MRLLAALVTLGIACRSSTVVSMGPPPPQGTPALQLVNSTLSSGDIRIVRYTVSAASCSSAPTGSCTQASATAVGLVIRIPTLGGGLYRIIEAP